MNFNLLGLSKKSGVLYIQKLEHEKKLYAKNAKDFHRSVDECTKKLTNLSKSCQEDDLSKKRIIKELEKKLKEMEQMYDWHKVLLDVTQKYLADAQAKNQYLIDRPIIAKTKNRFTTYQVRSTEYPQVKSEIYIYRSEKGAMAFPSGKRLPPAPGSSLSTVPSNYMIEHSDSRIEVFNQAWESQLFLYVKTVGLGKIENEWKQISYKGCKVQYVEYVSDVPLESIRSIRSINKDKVYKMYPAKKVFDLSNNTSLFVIDISDASYGLIDIYITFDGPTIT